MTKLRNYVRRPGKSFRMLRSLLDDYPRLNLKEIGERHEVTHQRVDQVLQAAREANLMPHRGELVSPGVDIVREREYRLRERARAVVFECKVYGTSSDDLGWALSVLAEPLSQDSPFLVEDEMARSMLGELL